MKVAYVNFVPPDGAAQRHVEEFSRAASDLGHTIEMYPMNRVAANHSIETTRKVGSGEVRKALRRPLGRYLHEPKELLLNLPFALRLHKSLKRSRPEVLLVRDHVLEASCPMVAQWLNLPMVIELNAPALESRLYFDQYAHLPLIPEWLERQKLQMADAVTVVSTALRDYLLERYPLSVEKILVNPNGADAELFSPTTPADPEVSATLASGPIVGFVGSFQKWHGSHLLAELIREVASADSEVQFLLVGDGPDLDGLIDSVSEFRSRIMATGRVERQRIPSLVSCIDIAVTADSTFWSSPLKVVEWMASATAIVAPDYGPLRDLLTDGLEGILFPPKDGPAMISAVRRLLEQPALRHRLGNSARARVVSSLTWKHNANRVMTVCKEAADRRHLGETDPTFPNAT